MSKKGRVDRHQSIYMLCKFIPPREWVLSIKIQNVDTNARKYSAMRK